MARTPTKRTLDELSPTGFENLIFDLMVLRGMSNVQWRTPGADGGRDIEGLVSALDFSGHQRIERWYVECKRYKAAINWPTIYEKIAHADAAGADILLLCTQSTFSPTAISRTENWNLKQGAVKVRLWPRHDLNLRLGEHPDLKIKYGLSPDKDPSGSSITQLLLTTYKTLTSYSAAMEANVTATHRMLQASLAILSLVHKKMEDIELTGATRLSQLESENDELVDIRVPNDCKLDRHGTRAFSYLLAALSNSKVEVVSIDSSSCKLSLAGGKEFGTILTRHASAFNSICFWSNFDSNTSDDEVVLNQRRSIQ